MKIARILSAAATLGVLASLAVSARAAIILDFSSSLALLTQTGRANAAIVTGTITNTGSSEVFLNALSLNFGGAPANTLKEDDDGSGNTTFTNSVPLSLQAGQAYTGAILGVFAAAAPPNGVYTVTAEIDGGATGSDLAPLASRSFAVRVAIPETGTLALFGVLSLTAGIAALGTVAVRRKPD